MSVSSKFRNAGQVCVSPTRFIVHENVEKRFTEKFAAKASSLRVGHGLEDGTQMGSLANERRHSAIRDLVEDARKRGGKIHTGGTAVESAGWFFQPTVFTDVPGDARVLTEEPFGPIAVITPYRDLDEAIARANALPYGLAAYAFTQDLSEAIALSNGVESGMIGINSFGIALAELPFGGIKDSGYGSEGGTEGFDGYLQTKSVTMS
jgi:succinate-semialdehyde dehydrogenase / glutarate-semialdehyde dehydrogenase